jgi:hypothetical protein
VDCGTTWRTFYDALKSSRRHFFRLACVWPEPFLSRLSSHWSSLTLGQKMSESDQDNVVRARMLAGLMLVATAGRLTASLDRFSSWALASGGAFLALLIASAKDLTSVLPQGVISQTAFIFLYAAVVGVIQKYMAAGICGAAESAKSAMEFGEKVGVVDRQTLFSEMERGYPRPWRYAVSRAYKRSMEGDYSFGGRMLSRLSLLHSLLVLLETSLLLWALGKIVYAIKT